MQLIIFPFRQFCLALTLMLFVSLPCLAIAQEGEEVSEAEAKALATQIYEKVKAAKSIKEHTEVIGEMDAAMEKKLPKSRMEYFQRLSAWMKNRRGQLYVDEAIEFASKGDATKAAEADAKALADFEASAKGDPTKWRPFHNRGVSYATMGKYAEAIKDFDRVIKLTANDTKARSSHANAWFNRGEAYYALGQFENALSDYNRAIQLNSRDAGAHVSRGHAHFEMRRFQDAVNDYSRAVSLDSRNAEYRSYRADAYQSLRRWENAANDYRQAIRLDENYGRAYQNAAWLAATCPSERFRDAQLALDAANRAIELDGEDEFQYLDTLAAAQANAGKFEEAVATISRAIKNTPQDQRERLQYRLKLYENEKPYRQGMYVAKKRGPTEKSD